MQRDNNAISFLFSVHFLSTSNSSSSFRARLVVARLLLVPFNFFNYNEGTKAANSKKREQQKENQIRLFNSIAIHSARPNNNISKSIPWSVLLFII